MFVNSLSTKQSPDLPDVLIHMTGRQGRLGTGVRDDIAALDPTRRLASILFNQLVAPTTPFGCDWPVVCLTQTTRTALAHLTLNGRYNGTGIAFHTQAVFDVGGGPAFYVRGDEFNEWRAASLPESLKARAVRFWPGSSNSTPNDLLSSFLHGPSQWLHEREWRIPRPSEEAADWSWQFKPTDVAFLLVKPGERDTLLQVLAQWDSNSPSPHDLTWITSLPVATLEPGGEWRGPSGVDGWP